MKVLQFLTGIGVGGIERFVADIVSHSSEEYEYDFFVFGREETEFLKYIKTKGEVYVCRGWSFAALKALWRVLGRKKYDVVHAHAGCYSFIVLAVAAMRGVGRRIAHSHSADSFAHLDKKSKPVWLLSRIFGPLFITDYLACSNHAAENTFGPGVLHSGKYKRILNPVDVSLYNSDDDSSDAAALRRELGLRENSRVVCNVGYLGRHKNQSFILRLALEHPDDNIDWLLVGDGSCRGEFEKFAEDNSLSGVHFAGIRNDVPKILGMCDVFILPSVLEGLGTVVLEAQAAGTPCIVSENVTCETDLGLGLVTRLPLSEPDKWYDAIISVPRTEIDRAAIEKAFSDSGVEINKCTETVEKIYKG